MVNQNTKTFNKVKHHVDEFMTDTLQNFSVEMTDQKILFSIMLMSMRYDRYIITFCDSGIDLAIDLKDKTVDLDRDEFDIIEIIDEETDSQVSDKMYLEIYDKLQEVYDEEVERLIKEIEKELDDNDE